MSERWWAPGGSTDLLTPGTDAKADLGLFLLAAHRAGAQALVEVSKGAIPSETGIITALAETRAKIGPQLVDAVSAHLEPTYAGLLVADVLDAGDRGAVDVYRAMVAKGVSPPVALERASQAYGMPMRQMGGFTHLATDPKANPRAVADAADRALMSYVSKMADAEAPAVAEVIKAELSVAERTDFDRLHPRDASGQFTETPDTETKPAMSTIDRIRMRLGLLNPEPARVAEITSKPESAKPERAHRGKRGRRAHRPKAQLVPTTERTTLTSSVQHGALQAHAITTAINAGTVDAKPPKNAPTPIIPELLVPLPQTGAHYYDISQPVIIGVPMDASKALRDKGADQAMTQRQANRRIFRMGYLVEQSHYVEQFGANQAGAHASKAGDTVQQHADTWLEPKEIVVTAAELMGSQDEVTIQLERKRKREVTRTRTDRHGEQHEYEDVDEMPYVKVLKKYRPYRPTGSTEPADYVVVHYQENEVGERAMPMVDEYVIEYDAHGAVEGETKSKATNLEVELDPNQVYELVHAPYQSVRRGSIIEPERSYDPVNHVEVNRWYLRPVSEDEVDGITEGFEKALDVLEARTFEQLHPRDAEGQFTEVAERPTLISPAARPMQTQRVQRLKRARRHRRVQPTAAAPEQTQQRTLTSSVGRRTQTSVAHQALSAPHLSSKKKLRSVPVLADDKNYRVFSEDEFQAVFKEIDRKDFEAMHTKNVPLQLVGDNKRTLHKMGVIRVDTIPEMMALNLGQEISRQQVARDNMDEIKYHSRGGVPDWQHVAERVHHLLDSQPEYDLIEIERNDDEHMIIVYGAMISGGFQNIVEFDPLLDWSGEIEIRFLGEFRARDALARSEDVVTNLVGELEGMNSFEDDPSKTSVANPMIHRYQVTSPPVRRYRADNR